MYKKLVVYDLDDTLLNLKLIDDEQKVREVPRNKDIEYPYVPKALPAKYYNKNILNLALKDISNKDNYTVLLTGRPNQIFRQRVETILLQQDLQFDEVHLCNIGEETNECKIKLLQQIIKKVGGTGQVEFYDDKEDYLKQYGDTFSEDHEVVTHLVRDGEIAETKTYREKSREVSIDTKSKKIKIKIK